jgi:hypothetical protein
MTMASAVRNPMPRMSRASRYGFSISSPRFFAAQTETSIQFQNVGYWREPAAERPPLNTPGSSALWGIATIGEVRKYAVVAIRTSLFDGTGGDNRLSSLGQPARRRFVAKTTLAVSIRLRHSRRHLTPVVQIRNSALPRHIGWRSGALTH